MQSQISSLLYMHKIDNEENSASQLGNKTKTKQLRKHSPK